MEGGEGGREGWRDEGRGGRERGEERREGNRIKQGEEGQKEMFLKILHTTYMYMYSLKSKLEVKMSATKLPSCVTMKT